MKTKQERIAALLANEKTPFTKADEPMLSALSDQELDAIEKQDRKARMAALFAGTKAAINAPTTAEDYVAAAPAEVQTVLQRGLRAAKEHRARVLKSIQAAKKGVFTDEQLNAKSIDELEQLAKLAGVSFEEPVDFGGQGTTRQAQGQSVPDAPDLIAAFRPASKKE